MGWRVWGDDFTSSDFTSTNKFQTFKTNKDVVLKGFRTWVIVINDPIFTNMNAKIYSNEVRSGDNTPVKLLTTSTDSRSKAEVHTLEHGVKEIYFTFNDFPLQKDTLYNLVINGSGYSPTDSSYLAWMKAFPDAVYPNDFTVAWEKLYQSPYQVYMIGGEY